MEPGRPYPNLTVRYNSYNDLLEAKEKELIIALDPRLYTKFTIVTNDRENGIEVKRNFANGFTKIPGIKRENYVEVLYEGKYKLLKRIKTDLVEENVQNYGTGGKVKLFLRRRLIIWVSQAILFQQLEN